MKAFLPHIGWFVRGFIAVLLLTATSTAVAHDVPPSMVSIDIGHRTLNVELQLPLNELGTALQLPLTADPQSAVAQYAPQIQKYIQERLKVHAPDERPYTLHSNSLSLRQTHELNWTSNDWLVIQTLWQAPENANTESFTLDDSLIVHRVVSHKSLIYVRRDIRNGLLGDNPMLIGVISFGTTLLRVDGSDGTWWHGFGHLFSLGMQHIATGTDHLLFLLALLLPAPLMAVGRRWRSGKSTGASVRTIVTVVSGFTVGHSLTLALASVGWFQVPTHTIEVLIAVSIVISSLHAWRPLFAGKEIWLASAFGLIHGLAFAETFCARCWSRPAVTCATNNNPPNPILTTCAESYARIVHQRTNAAEAHGPQVRHPTWPFSRHVVRPFHFHQTAAKPRLFHKKTESPRPDHTRCPISGSPTLITAPPLCTLQRLRSPTRFMEDVRHSLAVALQISRKSINVRTKH